MENTHSRRLWEHENGFEEYFWRQVMQTSILTGKGQVTIPAGLRVVIQNCVLCSKTIGNQTEYPGITTILNHYPSPKR